MKKFLTLISILFMFTGTAWADDGNRAGVQFDSTGNLGLIYYGDDNGWAVGGGFGLSDLDMNSRVIDGYKNSIEYRTNFFIRKNFKIHAKTYLGLGVSTALAWEDGELESDVLSDYGVSNIKVSTNSWSVSPYLIIDHHLTKNFILNAGASIVKFKETRETFSVDYTDANGEEVHANDTLGKKETEEYFNPFFGLTYMF